MTAAGLSACSVRPEPFTDDQHLERAKQDHDAIYASLAPVQGPLTLSDAIARALKYNLDAQLSQLELTLQEKQFDLALYQMLPRLAVDAGYNWRNNDNAAESVSELTKQRSLEYSFSEQPENRTADLSFSWSLLDVGVSYFQARQQGYRSLMAVERRRKAIGGIVKGVQQAYWKALTAEDILPKLDPLLVQAQEILQASRESSAQRLQPGVQALDFQQNMLQVISQLQRIKSDMISSRIQLASLLNIPLTTDLHLKDTPATLTLEPKPVDMAALEDASLALRPELRESAYEEKVNRQDVYKEIVKMLPGVSVLGGLNYDSNKYLYNSTWGEVGIRATYNLVNLVEGPKAISAARAAVDVSKIRRLAVSVAVLTQVNLSYEEYRSALDDYKIANEIFDVQTQIKKASENAKLAAAQSKAELVRRDLSAMVAEIERDRSITQVRSALVNFYSAVGTDLVPPNADTTNLSALSEHIKAAIAPWESGELPSVTGKQPKPDGVPVSALPNSSATGNQLASAVIPKAK